MFSCGPYFHAFTAIPRRQPLDLSYGQAQPVGRTPWLELAVHHILNDLESVQLAHRHRYPFCRSHLGLQHREHGGRIAYAARKRTFLSSQKRTLLKSRNIRFVDNCDYVKSQSNLGGHHSPDRMIRQTPALLSTSQCGSLQFAPHPSQEAQTPNAPSKHAHRKNCDQRKHARTVPHATYHHAKEREAPRTHKQRLRFGLAENLPALMVTPSNQRLPVAGFLEVDSDGHPGLDTRPP